VYRHSDGYPNGVIPDLVQLFQVMKETGTVRDAPYAAANFVFFGKLRGMRLYYGGAWEEEREIGQEIRTSNPYRVLDPEEFEQFRQPHFLMGYGVEPVGPWHGDEEWLYEVNFDRDGSATVRVADSRDFPRWDELDELETDDPWDEVQWSFAGSLDGAYIHYCEDEA
jgi:hypothetical protein